MQNPNQVLRWTVDWLSAVKQVLLTTQGSWTAAMLLIIKCWQTMHTVSALLTQHIAGVGRKLRLMHPWMIQLLPVQV